jgi:cobalt/nickel transport system permease protein
MLAAVVLGPWRAMLALAAVLAVQALLFQDGGLTALGANITDMGLAGSLSGYAVAALAARGAASARARVVGGVLGAFVATLAAAALTALWLGLSGLYPLLPIVQLMLVTHVAIGLLEAALTGAVLATVIRWRPDLIRGVTADGRISSAGAFVTGAIGIALALAAFVSPFASALPDGLDHAAQRLGFAARAHAEWATPFAGYAWPFAASPEIATALAGILGTIAAALIAWAVSRGVRSGERHAAHR